ncbi:MAG: hypothetical protein KGK06_07710, partial [Xanthomonadaceae bacterium]|nr:hypothetical protein [Xanthomonadaceae bacterium]
MIASVRFRPGATSVLSRSVAPGAQSGKAECISPRRTRQPDAVLPGKVHSATVTFFHLAQGILVSRQIFINLPVADMQRSTAFFTALG